MSKRVHRHRCIPHNARRNGGHLQPKLQPEGRIVTGNFGLIGKKLIDPEAASADADPTPANSNPVFDSFTGYLRKNGVSMGIATSLELSLANNLAQLYALFQNEAFAVTAGRANITGSVTLFFQDATEIEEFLNETEAALEFQMTDLLEIPTPSRFPG